MTTGDKYTNIVTKKLLGTESFKDYFLDYLNNSLANVLSRVYDDDGTFGSTKVVISASGNDEIDLTSQSGTDGSGHDLTSNVYCTDVQIENVNSTNYDIALKYDVKPSGIQINARTAYPEYLQWEETIGESGTPTSVTDNGTNITFNVNSLIYGDREHTGRSCLVWKNTPAIGATTEAIAIETCTVSYSGGNNTITTTGLLGQSTVSETAADYTVLMLGPTVSRQSDQTLHALAGYWYIGYVTGAGSGSPPTIPSDATDNQNVINYSLSDLGSDWFDEVNKLKRMQVENWEKQKFDVGYNGNFQAVCSNNADIGINLFVAVGTAGEIQTSLDGITWVQRVAGSSFGGVFYDVCYSSNNDLFVAVGTAGAIQTSSDGVSWTQRTAAGGFTSGFRGVCYSNNDGLFVAVGDDGEIQTSPDGTTWTQRTAAGSYSGNFRAICYSSNDDLFVAVGATGEIQTSSDGTTWTQRTAAGSYTDTFYGICYSEDNDLYIAVGDTGEIQTSSNGTTWTQRTAAGSYTDDFRDVCYGSVRGSYIAVGENGEIQRSSDGITWYQRTADKYCEENFYAVCASDSIDLFVIVGIAGEIQTSSDVFNWYQVTTGDNLDYISEDIYHIFSNNKTGYEHLFIAVGEDGNIQTSVDGIIWTRRTPAGSYTGNFYGGCYSNNDDLFVIVGGSGEIQTSPDGITWTQRTAAGSYTDIFRDICYSLADDLYVVVGYSGEIQTSPDGTTWTQRTPAGGYGDGFMGVCYSSNDDLFVAVGVGGEIQTSPDGTTWTQRTAAGSYTDTFRDVYYSEDDGLYVAVGDDLEIQTSPDGTTWTQRKTGAGSSTNFNSVFYANGLYVIVGGYSETTSETSQGIWVSNNCMTFYEVAKMRIDRYKEYLYSVTYGNDLFAFVGSRMNVMTSLKRK